MKFKKRKLLWLGTLFLFFIEWSPSARIGGVTEFCLPRRKAEVWARPFTRSTQHDLQGTISAFFSTTMAEDSYQTLLSILRDRDVPHDRDAIKAAFNDPDNQTTIQTWIQEYLTPETLLTRDEAALWDIFQITNCRCWFELDTLPYWRMDRLRLWQPKTCLLLKHSLTRRSKMQSKS